MVEIRRLRPDEWGQAVELTNRIFRDEEHTPMETAFRRSYSSSLSQSFGAFEDGKLVSFMGLVPAVIEVGPAKLNTYLLGQVCTDESARGKGYASRVMDAVLQHIEEAQASLMLVSGKRSLYDRAGCLPFGRAYKISLDGRWAEERVGKDSAMDVREIGASDWFRLKELADSRPVRFQYSLWDLADLIEAQSRASCMKHDHRVLLAERNGEAAGFLIYTVPSPGKNSTYSPEAVEWAGETETVCGLIAAAIRRHGFGQFRLSVPEHEGGLLQRIGAAADATRYPGTLHVVNPQRLLAQAAPYLRRHGIDLPADWVFTKRSDHGVILQAGDRRLEWTAQQFVDLLFTPSAEAGDKEDLLNLGWNSKGLPIPLPHPHGLLYV